MLVYNFSCYHLTKWVQEGQITQGECVIVAVLNGITIFPAIVLNALVLVSIWRTPALHTPSMVLLGSLALSDFGVGILAQPLIVVSAAMELKASEWPKMYCDIATVYCFFSSHFCGVSLLSITAVVVDRFMALHLHLRYRAIITAKKVSIVCCGIWLAAVEFGLSFILYGIQKYNITLCCVTGICAVVIIVSYFSIYKIIRKHRNQIQVVGPVNTSCEEDSSIFNVTSSLKYRKSIRNSLYIYFAFVLCYIPCFLAFAYYDITGDNNRSATFVKISVTIVFMNSGINPVIYCWKMKELRCAVRKTLPFSKEQ
ncbi:histamine H2 receptor [Nematostella vectensis]|uniref:histamine H2 receptor n=1 Tax=Nematostella vectensis TaxID=45351 RepID=UPI0020772BC9|nr:histamine H2 receptor [Nematostella vectensis]